MEVLLTELTGAEFVRRRAELVRDTTAALVTVRGMAPERAAAAAEDATASMLPRGPRTPRHLVRTASDGELVVGWIWLALPGTYYPDTAWVSDVAVDPPYRSRGYGHAIMLAAERLLAGHGVDRVGLTVEVGNRPARKLYAKLGYRLTGSADGPSLEMRKSL